MDQASIDELAAGVRGDVLSPTSAGYDEARRVWNGTVDKRPALIVRCQGVADVIEAVNFARDQGLAVSVRGGGHHVAGSAIAQDGLVVDLSGMRSVRVDPANARVRCEGGAQIGDLDRETRPFNLAVPMGVFSETGVGGLTLAGGVGWLRRKHGLACDGLISADVVLADGRLVTASASANADLYWALRGGGWDMGVVTSLEFAAHPVDSELAFLFVYYPIEDGQRVLRGLRDFGATAPDEISVLAVLWTFPHSEEYPEAVWGKQFVALAGPYAGPASEGERIHQPLRELATPLLDMSGRMPYHDIQKLFDAEYPVGRRYYWKSSYLGALADRAIDVLVELGRSRPSPLSSVDVWLLGGAIGRVGATDTPAGHREAPYLIGLEANWDDPSTDAINLAWTRDAAQSLAPFSLGSYLNFEDLAEAGVTAGYHGANFDRLRQLKQKYDPANLFRSRRGLVTAG
jgi:FAD/FMN-containing dehydrogenase